MRIRGMRLAVKEPEAAARWLQENLFFRREAPLRLRSGDFLLELVPGEGERRDASDHVGWRHAALETHDIRAAIEWCRSRGMELELAPDGGPCCSAKVYGTGMEYFNIFTPFGFTVEVARKLHRQPKEGERLIWGLEHVGLQAGDFDAELAFWEGLGFRRDFEPVVNTPDGHVIDCVMLSSEGTVVELYRFRDLKGLAPEEPAFYEALLLDRTNRDAVLRGPEGEELRLTP